MPSEPKLLFVDDNRSLVGIYALLLGERGFCVIRAHSGHEAVNLCQENSDDVSFAIVDLTMPGLDGPATIAQLQLRCPELKVIAISGGMLSPHFAKLTYLGVRLFLPKPFCINGLLDAIAQVGDFVADQPIGWRPASN